MDVTILLEPTLDLPRLAAVLDGLGHEGRYHTVRTWTKGQMRALFEAVHGFRPLSLDALVPAKAGNTVVHDGKNTLPVFSRFQKRLTKLEGDVAPAGGYNQQSMMRWTGPGYFVVNEGEGEHLGELVFDYRSIPRHKGDGWPEPEPNDGPISGMVNGGMVDYLRGLSTHVTLGAAYKHGRHRGQWFALVRRDERTP